MTEQTRWKRRPEGSTWGDFGPDDQCGRMNLLTPEKVLQGMREVREGITFNLSLPLDFPGGNVLNPRRLPPVLRPTLRNGKSNMNYQLRCDNAACTDVISDDLVVMHLQYSTQWDSLAHVGSVFDAQGTGEPQALYYNGFRAGVDVVGPDAASGAGILDSADLAEPIRIYMILPRTLSGALPRIRTVPMPRRPMISCARSATSVPSRPTMRSASAQMWRMTGLEYAGG